jgi:hypothetical protein
VAHHLMLPAAALSLLGAGLGVYLGNGAIGEINPAYFQSDERPSRFYADMTPSPPRNWAAVQASELRAAEQGLPLHPACIGCRTYPVDYFPVHEASLGKPRIGWAAAEAPTPTLEAEPAMMEAAPELASTERYAHFPVEAEEEPETAPADPIEYAAVEEPAAE